MHQASGLQPDAGLEDLPRRLFASAHTGQLAVAERLEAVYATMLLREGVRLSSQ